MSILGPNIHIVCSEFLQLTGHHEKPDGGIVQGVESECAALRELINVPIEPIRELGPMQRRMHVMANVVAVIVCQLVHIRVDEIVGEVKRILMILRVHKNMLGKVSEHQQERGHEIRNDNSPKCRLSAHSRVQKVCTPEINSLSCNTCHKEGVASATEEVIGQLNPDGEHVSHPVLKEMENIIALIRHGSRDIIRENVIFNVMHDNMVEIVGSRGQAKEWSQNILRKAIEDISLRE